MELLKAPETSTTYAGAPKKGKHMATVKSKGIGTKGATRSNKNDLMGAQKAIGIPTAPPVAKPASKAAGKTAAKRRA